MNKVNLSIKLKLNPTEDQKKILKESLDQYTAGYNFVCQTAWDAKESNRVNIHHLTYYQVKGMNELGSQLNVSLISKASESVKSARTKLRKGKKASCPRSKLCSIRYDARSYSIKDNIFSLKTTEGRLKIPFIVPERYAEMFLWKHGSADLCLKNGVFWIHLSVSKDFEIEQKYFVGVDMGVTRPFVTSDNQFFGEKRWKEHDRKLARHRKRLQAKGTKSAKRRMKLLSGRRNRFRVDCDHVLTKRLLQSQQSGTVLVLEDLTNLNKSNTKKANRKRTKSTRRKISEWSYARRRKFLEYKAPMFGCSVVCADPMFSSQECSKCGHVDSENRSRADFKCTNCGFEINADLNAARNLVNRQKWGSGKSCASGLPVNQPIVDGFRSQAQSFTAG